MAQMDNVKKAMNKRKILIAKGTTNAFIVEELTGRKMDKATYTGGYIAPAGMSRNPNPPRPWFWSMVGPRRKWRNGS